MPPQNETQDGSIYDSQGTDSSGLYQHYIDEKQFQDWQKRWNSKDEVIQHLLLELEHSMSQRHLQKQPTLKIMNES